MALLQPRRSRAGNIAATTATLSLLLIYSIQDLRGDTGDGPPVPSRTRGPVAKAGAPTPLPKPSPKAKRDPALGTARMLEDEAPETLAVSVTEKSPNTPPVAAARFEGLAAPGVQIRLKGSGSTGPGLRYRWIQTQGPTAEMTDSTSEMARVTIPDGARTLGFLLVVSNESGMDSIPLTVPVEGRSQVATDSNLRADAGDDQIGVVGRQITLNGLRSEPRGKIGYRWIQVGGPPVRLKIEEGHVFTFVPTEPGTHRFALVVAEGGVISEPDEVQVAVEFAGSKSARMPAETRGTSSMSGSEGLASVVQAALSGLEGGPAGAEMLGQTFDGVAGRMNLFRSYDEAYSEISRRLDAIVPQEPAARSRWVERLFAPITTRMVEEVRKEGLDLSTAAGRAAPLNEAQRIKMIEIFRAVGDGSRAVSRAL